MACREGGPLPEGRAMYDHAWYLRRLSEFTRFLLTPYDVETVLTELANRVSEVLDLLGSGVSLARDGRLVFDTAYGPEVADVERTQEEVQRGPCVTAFTSRTPVIVSDLAAESDRWPEFCRAAESVGLTAVASIPMVLGDQAVGALNLYARGPRVWDPDDIAAAVVMADMATAYLINASGHRRQVELNQQLQRALDSRLVIEQAKGMLAARRGTSPDRAFELIRAHARSHNVTLHSVADAIVRLGLDL